MTAQASKRLIYKNKKQSLCTEINELCKELEGERQFEKALFNEQKIYEVQNSQTKSESQLCSMDIETELQKILDEQLKDSRSWMDKSYDYLSQTPMDVLSQYKDQFIQFYNKLYEQDSTIYYAK